MGSTSKKGNEKLVNDLSKELGILNKVIGKAYEDIVSLEKGDGDKAYWNGANAYDSLRSVLKKLSNVQELSKDTSEIIAKIAE